MKKFIALAAVAAASVTLSAAAFAQDAPKAQAPAAAPAGAPGKGHIIFFRPSRLSGMIYTYHVVETGDDGKQKKDSPVIGDLPNGAAFAVDIEPGIHDYNVTGPMAVNKADDRLRMEVEPGETYYVEQQLRIGLITGGFRLVPADQARFTESHAKMKQ
jgi:hypothetical protein